MGLAFGIRVSISLCSGVHFGSKNGRYGFSGLVFAHRRTSSERGRNGLEFTDNGFGSTKRWILGRRADRVARMASTGTAGLQAGL